MERHDAPGLDNSLAFIEHTHLDGSQKHFLRRVMDPQQEKIAAEFDAYESNYTDAVNKSLAFSGLKADFFTRVKARSLLDLARTHLGDPRTLRALDFGCGVGSYHTLLAPEFAALSGVDISSACVSRARALHPSVSYKVYDGHRLPYTDGVFDLTFAITVFHHIPPASWDQSISEMRRILRPGGIAAIYEHNPLNPLTMRVVNNCPFDADATLLRRRQVRAMMLKEGFDRVEAKTILTVPPIGALGRVVDRAFAGLSLGAQYYVAGRAPGN